MPSNCVFSPSVPQKNGQLGDKENISTSVVILNQEKIQFFQALELACKKGNLQAVKAMLSSNAGKEIGLGELSRLKCIAKNNGFVSLNDYLFMRLEQKQKEAAFIKEKYLLLNVKNEAYLSIVFESLTNLNNLNSELKNNLAHQGVNLNALSELAYRIGERQKVALPTFLQSQKSKVKI